MAKRLPAKQNFQPHSIQALATQDEWNADLRLPNGRIVRLRPIAAEDIHALKAGFSLLSPEDIRFRFFHPMRELSDDLAQRLTQLDDLREFALVISEPLPPGESLIGAVARLAVEEKNHSAEFALLVAAPLKHMGLGRFLIKKLISWAAQKNLHRIYGDVHVDNHVMFHLAHSLGFSRTHVSGEPGLERVSLELIKNKTVRRGRKRK